MNLNNRQFQVCSNQASGEADGRTIFTYFQNENILWGTYNGGNIQFGTLTGVIELDGRLRFAYQHVNERDEIMTGRCVSTPEELGDGRLRFHERWQWTCGDHSSGESIIEEIVH